ncbi:MAG: hypothetical protein OEZ16_06685 [Chromatiales bacterium]|nr:hypothetical protein [Chromatiales bacterium]
MEIKSALTHAVSGIQRGMEGLDRNADQIAKASTGSGDDLVKPLVESHLNQLQVEANVEMLKTVDDTIGSLLDELA